MEYESWKKWASLLKSNIYALYLISRDKRTPLLAKVAISIVVAYALSPIDLIPDFIPVIGLLDDLILLPLGIWFVIRIIPAELWKEHQILATKQIREMPASSRAAILIIVIWIVSATGFIFWIWQIT